MATEWRSGDGPELALKPATFEQALWRRIGELAGDNRDALLPLVGKLVELAQRSDP